MFETTRGALVQRFPVIFPEFLIHVEVATVIQAIDDSFTPVSAGSINSTDMEVHGGSDTLNLISNPEDSKTIRMFDYFYGYQSPE